MNTKSWLRIGGATLLLAITGVYAVIRLFPGGASLADTLLLADTRTGELFRVSVAGRGVMPPLVHPETQRATLVPVVADGEGWRFDPRYAHLTEPGVSIVVTERPAPIIEARYE